jgi:hypothetical protein
MCGWGTGICWLGDDRALSKEKLMLHTLQEAQRFMDSEELTAFSTVAQKTSPCSTRVLYLQLVARGAMLVDVFPQLQQFIGVLQTSGQPQLACDQPARE